MRPINVYEYEELARTQLHPAVWDYYSSGANNEVTLRENRAAFIARLREIGFYSDLSDAYLTQTITPRYIIEASAGAGA